jgi:polysaccharide export outer membrane protein
MKVQLFRIAVTCLLILLLAGCEVRAVRTTAPAGVPLPPPDTTSATGEYKGGSDYRVGAQDLLEISVFGVPDLSRTVRVNSSGGISLPLIGGVQAGGHTVSELEKILAELLSKNYLQNPQVSVFVKEYTSQRITLEGSLKNPGIYPITGKTTLLQAIAIGGGLDPLADLKGVVVFRHVEGKKMAAVFDLRDIRAGRSEDPQVFGDDVIVIEQSGSKTALRRVIETIPIIALFTIL